MNAEEVPAVTPGQAAYLAWHRRRVEESRAEGGAAVTRRILRDLALIATFAAIVYAVMLVMGAPA